MVNYIIISNNKINIFYSTLDLHIQLMTYFTWKEEGLTNDCETLDSMAARFEESARLMRKMSAEGFKVEKRNQRQIITHTDSKIFNDWGFISEEPPYQQLTLILEKEANQSI